MDTVTTTKTKHPGRVAQGHKLVALNRERKAALKQPEQQPEQQPAQQSQTSTVVYGSRAIAMLVRWCGALLICTLDRGKIASRRSFSTSDSTSI